MDEKTRALPEEAQFDIFLCTRELPDKLTAETAALRQLCAALVGEGYSVFFPSALPGELTDEQRAQKILDALRSSRVMVAAGVGPEGLADVLSQGLWGAFLKSGEDAENRFFFCWRDQGEAALPVALTGKRLYDMSELGFLSELKAALSAVLPPPVIKETAEECGGSPAEPEGTPEDKMEEETEGKTEGEQGEASPEEPEGEQEGEPAAEKRPFPWKWVLLGAAVLAAVLWFFFRK